jgi:pyranose oxidase
VTYYAPYSKEKPFISLGKNPAQNPFVNLGAEAVTRGVGGMTTHWTCATPEFCKDIERPLLDANAAVNDRLWNDLYREAKEIIGTSETQFNESIRHNLVLRTYQQIFANSLTFKPLPLACHRLPDPDYVEWHATDRILETLFTDDRKKRLFTLLTNHRCTRVVPNHFEPGKENDIVAAEVKCLLPHAEDRDGNKSTFYVRARAYVVACGSVATAQVSTSR